MFVRIVSSLPAAAFLTPLGAFGATGARSGIAKRSILVLGDSLSAEYGIARGTGWVALLEQRLAERATGWQTVNASISGETTSGGAARIDGLLTRVEPAILVVELGGNDALRGLDLADTQRNLERIVRAGRDADAKVLILATPIPPNYGRAYTQAYAKLFADVAAASQTRLVPDFLAGIAQNETLFQSDRIHPTGHAQALLLENAWSGLEPMLESPAANRSSTMTNR